MKSQFFLLRRTTSANHLVNRIVEPSNRRTVSPNRSKAAPGIEKRREKEEGGVLPWVKGPDSSTDKKVRKPKATGLFHKFVEMNGFEPMTPCLQSRCSSQLSYTPFLKG